MSLVENVRCFVHQLTPRAASNQVVTTTQTGNVKMHKLLSSVESVVMPRDKAEAREFVHFIDDDVRGRFGYD